MEILLRKVKAYGEFAKKGAHIYRKSAYIQWGKSKESLGACLLLNPGSATLNDELSLSLNSQGNASGKIKAEDPTMKQLNDIVENIYENDPSLSGRLYIYNLFNLQNTKAEKAIDLFERQVQCDEYQINDSLVTKDELQQHPWILIGWGINTKKKWANLELVKDEWLQLIRESGITIIGKKHEKSEDYYHPCPQLQRDRSKMVKELVEQHRQSVSSKIKKGSQLLIEKYVNNQQDFLNKSILMTSPSLLYFIHKDKVINWESPLEKYREYRNDFLGLYEEWDNAKSLIENYWPKSGPSWDGVATVLGKDGKKGLLLVEAKAHVQEMRSRLKAKDETSIDLIIGTIKEAKAFIGSQAPIDTWLNHYYQLANRLAYLYILNEKMYIPTWLVLINFIEDQSYKPTSIEEWVDHYHEVFTEMDIKFSSILLNRVVLIYPERMGLNL